MRQYKHILPLFVLSALILSAIEATAQTRPRASRIGVVNPMSPDHTSYLEFYEFEQVDVQPSFPGGERGLVNFVNNSRISLPRIRGTPARPRALQLHHPHRRTSVARESAPQLRSRGSRQRSRACNQKNAPMGSRKNVEHKSERALHPPHRIPTIANYIQETRYI